VLLLVSCKGLLAGEVLTGWGETGSILQTMVDSFMHTYAM